MLAAITHDLQTPLTRLRLRLEKVSDAELRDKLIADMSATQQMLQEGLEFARSLDTSVGMQSLDVDSLLDSLCCDASDSGQDVQYAQHCNAELLAHPLALRRAISNVLDNAVKYGQRAEVAMRCADSQCHINIRDHGTGIPESELEKVFAPFYRLEQSRSRNTGGSGLGLAIARNILRQHGGTISLSNHVEGGLEAHITLPLNS
jgi:signal transduction histidine kinase